jgi:hypothetical protein
LSIRESYIHAYRALFNGNTSSLPFVTFFTLMQKPEEVDWGQVSTPNYELSVECLKTNYYGMKRVTESLLPLLQLSNSPRLVSVSSSVAKLLV